MSLERAMHLATMDFNAIGPVKQVKLDKQPRHLFTPTIGIPINSWIPLSEPYSDCAFKDGKKARFVQCDCVCGRTTNQRVMVSKLKSEETKQCRFCVMEKLHTMNQKRIQKAA